MIKRILGAILAALILAGPTFAQSPALSNVAKLTAIRVVTDPAFAGGAKGDCTTNDTAAIQAAITAGSVYVPKPSSCYKLTAPVTVSSNRSIICEAGTNIKQATTQIDTLQINNGSSNIHIEGCLFSGTGSTITGKGAIHFIYTSSPITDVVITGNTFTNPSTSGITTDPSNRVVISNNTFNGTGDTSIYLSNCLDCTVTGNVIISPTRQGIQLRNGSVGGGRVAISGNVIRAAGDAATAGIISDDVNYKEISITGNVIMDGAGDGIQFGFTNASKLSITGNTITGNLTNGIQLTAVTNAVISGNLITTSTQAAIRLNAGSRYNFITGNSLFDNNTANNALAGILDTSTGDNLISNNFIKSQYNNSNCIKTTTSANNYIHSNDVSQCAIVQANRIVPVATDTVRHNKGWVTENQGTATITSGTTSVVVNHGCNRTPAAQNVLISARAASTNAPGLIWVDTFTATQMTLHSTADPGASGLFLQWSVDTR